MLTRDSPGWTEEYHLCEAELLGRGVSLPAILHVVSNRMGHGGHLHASLLHSLHRRYPLRAMATMELHHDCCQRLARSRRQWSYSITVRAFASLSPQQVEFGKPSNWFSKARHLKRRIICHVGPTNSGKTHEALERLARAKSGLYCGPLRLLAWEVYEKLNAVGVPCNLRTGQEIKEVPKAQHVSCTVEMADVSRSYECAVVDECQLLSHKERGWAWTRAVLGIPAMELHLCGSPAFIELIERLSAETGDYVDVVRYQRLSRLEMEHKPIRTWADVRAGDCIVAFSRRTLFQIKNEIELQHPNKLRCCIVYGGLPPEARREQARLFNNPESGFDVLVASDAIGMGLNLSIGRIIFSTLLKFNGEEPQELTGSEIKQIAGRAGRFSSAFDVGLVAARKRDDLRAIRLALEGEDDQLVSAGLKPTREQLEMFATACGLKVRKNAQHYRIVDEEMKRRRRRVKHSSSPSLPHPWVSFFQLIEIFEESASLGDERATDESSTTSSPSSSRSPLYFMCELTDMIEVARTIEDIPLLLPDRYTFSISPVDSSSEKVMSFLRFFAFQLAKHGNVVLGMDELDNLLSNDQFPTTPTAIKRLEELHSVADVYLWLGLHFPPGVFVDMEEAGTAAERCSELIEAGLRKLRPMAPKGRGDKGGGDRAYGGTRRQHGARGTGRRSSRVASLG